jgi:nucleoside 2-deoxyribosyltransferase
MVDFIKKRLQVFVSSTFSDLREERQAAVEAILAAGHIPAGMELFAAGDESQMEVIKQWIDESDVYLLILGGRYGSIDPKSGKSYTQLEYEYALSKGNPLFACVIKDAALDARIKKYGKEAIDDYRKEWNQFREFVQSKIVEFWETQRTLKSLSLISSANSRDEKT